MLKIKRFALATLLIGVFIVFFCQTIYSFFAAFKLVKVPEILYYLSIILVFDVVFIFISLGYQTVRDELKKRKENGS
jgi:magnesium-transporting ATPase (P-type)